MTSFIFIATHSAVAYLHFLLSWRFFPQRKTEFSLYVFWLMMVLSCLLHVSYALSQLLITINTNDTITFNSYIVLFGYWLLAFLPALLATLFIGELTISPKKSNVLIKAIASFNRNIKKLFISSLLISVFTLLLSLNAMLTQSDFQLSFGNHYALYYMFTFGILWLLMFALGFRPNPDNGNVIKPIFRLLMASLIILYAIAHIFDFEEIWRIIPIITTVGLSLCFCWYRFRTQFIDVIINQFIRIIITIFITFGFVNLWQISQQYNIDLQYLAVFTFLIATAIVYQQLNRLLIQVWHPPTAKLELIHVELPGLLAKSHAPQAAINITEQYLTKLFNATIIINRKNNEELQLIAVDGDPQLNIQLGYLRGWMPWFSEAIFWVRTSGLYLQKHLKILASLEKEHRQRLNTEALISLAAKAELQAMRSQIRPHFLFNILNSIHCFVRTDPKMAEQTIEILSEIMRSVLIMSDQDTVELHKELSVVEKYLFIEKIRYGEQFTYAINISTQCNNLLIPPFSVQPLVENAIKHAVDAQFEPVNILINVKIVADDLLIEVIDDGPGLYQQTSSLGLGIALNNIKSRLALLYGKTSQLKLINNQLKGIKAVINIPLPNPALK